MAAKKTSTKAATAPKTAASSSSGAKAKKPATAKTLTKTATKGNGKKEKSLSDLLGALSEKTGLTKAKTREFLDAQAALLTEELKQNGSVVLSGIGKLKLGARAARKGRNPQTGQEITIPASKTVKLAAGKAFKESFQ
jgi:DNA-binding protein HU-beta